MRIKIAYWPENVVVTCLTRFLVFDLVPSVRIPGVIFVERVTDLENDTDETIWVKVRARGQTFLLCNTYRPEWTDNEYWTRLNHAIGMGYQVNDNIVMLGDLNSDLFIANNNK